MIVVSCYEKRMEDQEVFFKFEISDFSSLMVIIAFYKLDLMKVKVVYSNKISYIYFPEYHEMLGTFFRS